ncbi:MAG: LysM peptidoglycan-binding domain-containing protein [Prosthecobacter sp.]|uniref:muramidase family protein n=1 Tax=Prosthecobacter sp. TaxID=1965333 RepID=UPI0038FF528F
MIFYNDYMKTLSFTSRVLVSLLAVLGFEASSFVSAQVSNTYTLQPPPGYPASGAPRQPVSTRAARQSAASVQAPANYTYPPPAGYTYPPPPGYGMPPPAKPSTSKKATSSTTTPKKSTPAPAPKYYGPTGDISSQVAKLAESDRVQNSRLGELERDVSGIKRGGKGSSTTRYNGGTDLASHTTHVVRPGDTMWHIASTHRVSVGEIQQLNRLSGENVSIGQTLLIPSPHRSSSTTPASYTPATPGSPAPTSTTYIVKKGDSLKAIAIRYKTTTTALAAANHIKDPNKLLLGQRLVIPGRSGGSTVASNNKTKPKTVVPESSDTIPLPGFGVPSTPAPAAIAPQPPAAPAPTPPKSAAADTHRGILAYRVDRSDTLESIAQQFSTTPDRIREMNRLQPGAKLNSGDEIMVPAMGAVSVGN